MSSKVSDYMRAEGSGAGERSRGWVETGKMALFMSGGGIEINGQKLTPDATKGYIEFFLAHGFPMVTCYNKTLHAGTVANSFQSMRHQGLNFEHRVKSYFHGSDHELAGDRYIGTILDAEFPAAPFGGWKLTDLESTPGMRCVAAIHKQAHGVDRFLGEHASGRHEWRVSLEVDYSMSESGVVVQPASVEQGAGSGEKGKKLPKEVEELCGVYTPDDFAGRGCLYLPVESLPDEMVDCWDQKKEMFTKPYRGRNLVLMMGGLNNTVHFKGTAVCRYGAEPTAVLGQVLASREPRSGGEEQGAGSEEQGAEEEIVEGLKRVEENLEELGDLVTVLGTI